MTTRRPLPQDIDMRDVQFSFLPSRAPPDPARAALDVGVCSLAEMGCRGDFSPGRWQCAVAVSRAIAAHWLDQALALRWSPLDLFGCHPVKPQAALHCAGLALALSGDDELQGLDHSTATIVRRGSATPRTFRRAVAPGVRILLWELEAP